MLHTRKSHCTSGSHQSNPTNLRPRRNSAEVIVVGNSIIFETGIRRRRRRFWMLSDGGKLYWSRNRARKKAEGIVVVFSWVSVRQDDLRSCVELYGSLGWNSLVCCPDFFNAFSVDKATSLAFFVLTELIEELRVKANPVGFVAISGGSKACLYKALQIIEGACDVQLHKDDCQMVKRCLSGIVFDSGPLDFTSGLVAKLSMHPSLRRLPGALKMVSWIAKGVYSGLDAMFLTGFESQRAEYWHTLHSSVCLGAPFLIFCSENDDLAPYHVISCFAQNLQNSGGDVKIVKWNQSHHGGHYKHHPAEYKAAMINLLEKARQAFSRKIRQLEIKRTSIQCMHDDDESELFHPKAAIQSNQSPDQATHSSLDTSARSQLNERAVVQLISPSGIINPHSVLSKVLFDACVPKNIEGWDFKFNCTVNGQPLASARRHSPSLGIKYARRSKL